MIVDVPNQSSLKSLMLKLAKRKSREGWLKIECSLFYPFEMVFINKPSTKALGFLISLRMHQHIMHLCVLLAGDEAYAPNALRRQEPEQPARAGGPASKRATRHTPLHCAAGAGISFCLVRLARHQGS